MILVGLGAAQVLHAQEPGSDASENEPAYYRTSQPGFRTTGVARFDFWFDIPVQWRAIDRSANGDGYFIATGEPGTDLRVFGTFVPSDRSSQLIEPFTFRDGAIGERFSRPGEIVFQRTEGDRSFVFQAVAPQSWLDAHTEQIAAIAQSLRPGVHSKEP